MLFYICALNLIWESLPFICSGCSGWRATKNEGRR